MKSQGKIITLFIVTILMYGFLCADTNPANKQTSNNDYGEWVRKVVEGMKEVEPINMQTVLIPKWKNHKDEIIAEYKELLATDSLDYHDPTTKKLIENDTDRIQHTNAAKRYRLLSNYYDFARWPIQLHNDTDLRDLLIYAYENDPLLGVTNLSIKGLGYFALLGDNIASKFIESHLNDDLPESIKIKLHTTNLLIHNDQQSVDYLMNRIRESQDVNTTDKRFDSRYEGIIVGGLATIPQNRLFYGLDYDYIVPLVKQLIYSRCKVVSERAMVLYRKCTNSAEIEKMIKEWWEHVDDENTPKDEFINALYGLQALLTLKRYDKHITNIDYTEIKRYIAYLDINSASKKLSQEEQDYFHDRQRSQTILPDSDTDKTEEPWFKEIGGTK